MYAHCREKQARRHDMKLRQQQQGGSRNSDATAALPEETEGTSAVDMAQVRSIQAPTKAGKDKKGRSKEELTGLLQQAEFKVRALEKKVSFYTVLCLLLTNCTSPL